MFRIYIIPVLALIGFYFGIKTVINGAVPPPIAQAYVEPTYAPFPVFVAGSGLVEANTENIAVASPLPGVVSEVHARVGDMVDQGAPLFSLEDRSMRAQLEVQKAAREVAQSELADAQNQLRIWQGVNDKRAVSEEELSKRQFAARTASAKVTQAIAQEKATETEIDRLTIRAPVAGQVLQSKIRVGEFAPAQVLATPLMLLGSVTPLHLRVDVDENDAWRVSRNAHAVAFVRGNRETSFPLTFVRFEPYVIPKRSLTGDIAERVDTRVLQVVYSFTRGTESVFVGQLMDVYIEVVSTPASGSAGADAMVVGQTVPGEVGTKEETQSVK